MSDAILSPEELEAIQKATGGNKPPVISAPSTDVEVSPIALIADDREGERARPRALGIGNRWAPALAARLKRAFNLELEVTVEGAEMADGSYVVREMPSTWCRALLVEGGKQTLCVQVGGPLVEVVAAILLGAKMDEDEEPPAEDRAPSQVARKLFARGGQIILSSLLEVWRDEDSRHLEPIADLARSEALCRHMAEHDPIIVVTIQVEAPVAGRIRLIGPPDAFLSPKPIHAAPTVPREVIASVIGGVGVDLVVELGGASLPMRQVKTLAPGALIKLDRSMSEPVPVRCEGVVKARGQVISQNGNFAVEVVSLVDGDSEE